MRHLDSASLYAHFMAHEIDPHAQTLVCALSGGLDSVSLLHLLHARGAPVRCVHVNHGLLDDADEWADFCVRLAAAYGYECAVHRLSVSGAGNLEERCRTMRYAVLQQELRSEEVLLTAHHQDDQVETFLLQLFRGAGPAGLQAMPAAAVPFGQSRHFRPLLPYTREALLAYARRFALEWREDPSNMTLRFDRNYVRQQLLPLVLERWPGARAAIHRSIGLMHEASDLLNQLAAQDARISADGRQLEFAALRHLDERRIANVVRYWLRQLEVRVPNSERLREAVRQFQEAGDDRAPLLSWSEGLVQRYRDTLVFFEPFDDAAPLPRQVATSDQWFALAPGGGRVRLVAATGHGISQAKCNVQDAHWRFRQHGESVRRGAGHHQTLKHWFQEHGVPGELRKRVPLLVLKGEVIAIAGWWIDARFRAHGDEPAWSIDWDYPGKTFCHQINGL